MTSSTESGRQPTNVGLWALRIVLSLAFLFFAFMKLSGQPKMVAEFDVVGLGQWFRYFTGIPELVGGLAILIPRISAFAAAAPICVDCILIGCASGGLLRPRKAARAGGCRRAWRYARHSRSRQTDSAASSARRTLPLTSNA